MKSDQRKPSRWTRLRHEPLEERRLLSATPLGVEVRANAFTAGQQTSAVADTAGDGSYVVAWDSHNQDGSGYGVYARRFSALGTPLSDEFRLNTHTAGNQQVSKIAVDDAGNFSVVWTGSGAQGDGTYARRFSATNQPLTTDVKIEVPQNPRGLALSAAGLVMIPYKENFFEQLHARTIDFNGAVTVGDALLDSDNQSDFVSNVQTSGNDAGEFLVVYEHYSSFAETDSVRAVKLNISTTHGSVQGIGGAGDFQHINLVGHALSASGAYTVSYQFQGEAGFTQSLIYVSSNPEESRTQPQPYCVDRPDPLLESQRYGVQVSVRNDASGQGVYTRAVEYGPSGPVIVEVRDSDGVDEIRSNTTVTQSVAGFTLTFDRGVSTEGGASGAQSVLNPANWVLTSNGVDISDRITNIAFQPFKFHQNASKLNQATVLLDGALNDGNYVLTLRDQVVDQRGDALDGDKTCAAGGDLNLAFTVDAADAVPVGEPIALDEPAPFEWGNQFSSPIAMDADGDMVVAWLSKPYGIYARRFDADSEPAENATRVDTYGLFDYSTSQPSVAMDPTGDYVVTWAGYVDNDGGPAAVFARAFRADGTPRSEQFVVDSQIGVFFQNRPQVVMESDGDYTITWSRDNVRIGQRYDVYDVPRGGQFSASLPGPSNVAYDADGDYVVVDVQHEQVSDVSVELFRADGSRDGRAFFVDPTNHGYSPFVARAANGDFAVVYKSYENGVLLQRFDDLFDSAGPQVANVYLNGRKDPHEDGKRLPEALTTFTVSFTEELSQVGGATGAHSITNPDNWILRWRGSEIDVIDAIEFHYDAEVGRYLATATLATGISDGVYEISLRDTIQGTSGFALDGDGDGTPGGDSASLTIVVAQPQPRSEFQVNTYTAGNQVSYPATQKIVAMTDDGKYAIVWNSENQDGSGWGVYGQRYAASGSPVGNEFRLNFNPNGDQRFASVASNGDGAFIAGWTGVGSWGPDTGVWAQRFWSDPVPWPFSEVHVNDRVPGEQLRSIVAMNHDGRFVVVWESAAVDGFGSGVVAQLFNAMGNPIGPTFRVNETFESDQRLADVAFDASGRFVVTWSSFGQDDSGDGVYARRYGADGRPLGGEFRVNTTTGGGQRLSRVAVDDDGDFWITWMSNGQDGSGYGIYAQRFNAAGEREGAEFRINSDTEGNQQNPAIAMDNDGDVVIAWTSAGDVKAKRFSPTGAALTNEWRVHFDSVGQQGVPSVAMDADGDFVIAWQSEDQDGFGIFATQFSANSAPIADAGGPYTVGEGGSLQLDASATFDPDQGETLTYAWDIDGDGEFDDAVGVSPTVDWNQLFSIGIQDGPSNWPFIQVKATDSTGQYGISQPGELNVVDTPPTIFLMGGSEATEGWSYTLTMGMLRDLGRDTVTSYIVNWGDGESDTYTTRGEKTHVYADGTATRTITIDVVDEDGLHIAIATKTVQVANAVPTLESLSAAAINEGQTAVLTGVAFDRGSLDPLTLMISWGDGGPAQVLELTSSRNPFQIAHHYPDDPNGPPPDQYPISLVLHDDEGELVTASLRVTVRNVAPQAQILGAKTENPIGVPVTLTSAVTDPGLLDTFTYAWVVEQNGLPFATGAGTAITFTPTMAATYRVRLSITDDDGGVGASTVLIQVPGGNVPGDADGDGQVNLNDLNLVRNNFGGFGAGDTDGDGDVDLDDLNAVRNNFGAGSGAPIAVSTPRTLSTAATDVLFGALGDGFPGLRKRK